jgi:hypothetical protein
MQNIDYDEDGWAPDDRLQGTDVNKWDWPRPVSETTN